MSAYTIFILVRKVTSDLEKKYTGTDTNCFACGQRNDYGLKMKFATLADSVEAVFTPHERYQGWNDIVHGGIVSTMLDEAMSHAIFRLIGDTVVTAEMTVRFVRPMIVGREVRVIGWIDRDRGKLVETKSEIHDVENGKLIAKGEARFARVDLDQEPGV